MVAYMCRILYTVALCSYSYNEIKRQDVMSALRLYIKMKSGFNCCRVSDSFPR